MLKILETIYLDASQAEETTTFTCQKMRKVLMEGQWDHLRQNIKKYLITLQQVIRILYNIYLIFCYFFLYFLISFLFL